MLCSTGLLPRGEERHAAGPGLVGDPGAAGELCLQPQNGWGPKQGPGAEEPIQGDQDSNRPDPSVGGHYSKCFEDTVVIEMILRYWKRYEYVILRDSEGTLWDFVCNLWVLKVIARYFEGTLKRFKRFWRLSWRFWRLFRRLWSFSVYCL